MIKKKQETDELVETENMGYLANINGKTRPNHTESNGWNNLITLIAFLGIFRFIVINFLEFGWLVEIPFSRLSIKDFLYIFTVLALNLGRISFFFPSFKT